MMNLESKRVAVLGAGRSGKAAASLLAQHGADVCVFDTCSSVREWGGGIPLVLSATEEDGRRYAAELVVISPGVETASPFVRAFTGPAAELIGETELACRFYKGTIIAITGTNGKTTTTALTEAILGYAGRDAVACGNFGTPLSELLAQGRQPEILAMEVSSFQMETIVDFHPQIAVWLNFAPDHMDRYKTVEEYYEAKLHIFDNQTAGDLAIVRTGETLPRLKSRTQSFSSVDASGTLSYRDGFVCEEGVQLVDLRGTAMEHPHNAENVMAALLACRELGIDASTVQEVVRQFTPPGHRCELVATIGGVEWYNDSKATNLHALEAALRSLAKPVVLIAGGKDKGLDYTPLEPLLREKVRACIVFGEITEQLYRAFSPVVPTHRCTDIQSCVAMALQCSEEGDAVLFSPGTSSFDMFTGYAQRGQVFRDAVHALIPQS